MLVVRLANKGKAPCPYPIVEDGTWSGMSSHPQSWNLAEARAFVDSAAEGRYAVFIKRGVVEKRVYPPSAAPERGED